VIIKRRYESCKFQKVVKFYVHTCPVFAGPVTYGVVATNKSFIPLSNGYMYMPMHLQAHMIIGFG